MAQPARNLPRAKAKQRTRRRLLDAALLILDKEGEAGVTTVSVTRKAGVAQSTFYSHFADLSELLCELIDELWERRALIQIDARGPWRDRPDDEAALAEVFRTPLLDLIKHPAAFRLVMRSRHDPSTKLGAWANGLLESSRTNIVRDLLALGFPSRTKADRRRMEMIGDAVIGMLDALVAGHIDGRYAHVNESVEVLVEMSRSVLLRSKQG